MWSRQSGKSFAGTLETVDDSLERRALWIYLSRGERQSLELAEKAKLHLEAYRIAAEAMEDYFLADSGEKYTQLQLRLPNGSRHIFLPANPDTARGYSGNVFLDEFAFHKDSKAIWTALFPTITRNPSYRIRIV
ncbi:MAG: terminase family protein, partial [Candidatus Bipolaricaulaceae bacterium]